MGRRHSIAAKKAAGDAGKSKAYSMVSKLIQIAARKGADPKMNPSLELVLQKARYHSVPRDIVDRAILKWSGQLEGEALEEVFYEGYGPAGTALVVKTLTSNTNRTSSSVRTIFSKHGGNLGLPGSVARQFDEKGIILTDGKSKKETIHGKEIESVLPLNQDELETEALELPLDDIDIDDNVAVISTEKTNFSEVLKWLEAQGRHILEADLQYVPQNEMQVSEEDKEKNHTLMAALDNDEDVDKVRCNVKE